ncbi:MAG: helix-turn-helix domain-containing protein [Bacteroidales bacterium]|nr:helix-turn-helix domain-containing protein [Bacteroidales bacterium]
MSGKLFTDTIFIKKLTEVTEANLTNNQFGVSELARKLGMSRSYIHRRLKTLTNHSVSHFIRTVRLEKALEMLKQHEASAAEIAYNVGFSSPAYFSHCFHKHYGFPPGEVKKRLLPEDREENELAEESGVDSKQLQDDMKASIIIGKKFTRNKIFLMSAIILVVIALTWFFYFVFINGSFPPDDLSQQDKELSIIVLPFKNLSDNPNNQYFADGITEDILNNLYWITALRVVSRTSAEQFRESNPTALEIAREMDVKYVLEGSVRRYGEKTRISVQLIDAYRDKHLWSSYFDRELNDIIGVQDDIAFQVASKLKAVLSENEIRQIEKISTKNPKAYDYYLQGRFLLHKANSEQRFDFNRKDVMNCIQYYEKAISEDVNFAEAYAGLANAWLKLSLWGWLPYKEGFPKVRELCKKALEIDPECSEAYAVLGTYLVWGERKIEEGGKELMTSIQLNPNFSTARQWYAQFLMITGPIEDARFHMNRALELEPYFWVVQNLNAWIYYFENKYDKAIEACLLARDLKPDFIENEWLFVLNYTKLGEGEKAVQKLQTITKRYPGTEQYVNEISEAYNKSGINGLFTWLIEVNKNKPIPVEGMNGHPFFIAWWNAILGNREESVYWLEKNMESKRRLYIYFNLIATNPDFDILRDDPRFLKIIDEIGLSPYHHRKTK